MSARPSRPVRDRDTQGSRPRFDRLATQADHREETLDRMTLRNRSDRVRRCLPAARARARAGRQAQSAKRQAPPATRRTPRRSREARRVTARPTILSVMALSPLFETPLRKSHPPYRNGDRLWREARRRSLIHAACSIARARCPGRARPRGRQRREPKQNCGRPSCRTRRNRLLMGSTANVLGAREAGTPRPGRSTNPRPGYPPQRPSGENPERRPPSEARHRDHQRSVAPIKRVNRTCRSRGDDQVIPRHWSSGPRNVSLSSISGLLREMRAPSFDAGSCLDRDHSSPSWTLEDRKAREYDSTLHDWLIHRR